MLWPWRWNISVRIESGPNTESEVSWTDSTHAELHSERQPRILKQSLLDLCKPKLLVRYESKGAEEYHNSVLSCGQQQIAFHILPFSGCWSHMVPALPMCSFGAELVRWACPPTKVCNPWAPLSHYCHLQIQPITTAFPRLLVIVTAEIYIMGWFCGLILWWSWLLLSGTHGGLVTAPFGNS